MEKTEINSSNVDEWRKSAKNCINLVFFSLDLTPHDDWIASLPQAQTEADACVYIACRLGPKLAGIAAESYATVFPTITGKYYNPYRDSLYLVPELLDAFDPRNRLSYFDCMDWKTYCTYIKVGKDNKPLKPT